MPIKISQLTALGTVDGTVVIPVVDIGGVTPISKKSTISDVSNFILQGNAATATKFATARNINGVAFDGSADITITTDLAAATTSVIGGVIVGSGISVEVDGTISVAVTPIATTTVAGTVIVGSGISVEADGTISVDIIPVATTSVAGTVIVGNGLQVEVDGTVSTTTTPAFHGFVVNANGDLEYTRMTSGDLAVANGDATEQYVMWEIGTSDYSWQISNAGILQIQYTDSDI
jgi:hypothetical protein